MTAEEFYSLRDARTTRLTAESKLDSASATISIDTEEAQTFAGQMCLLTLANLMSRWCRSVNLHVPNLELLSAFHYSQETTLEAEALSIMHSADPFGNFSANKAIDGVHVHIGAGAAEGTYSVQGSGWIATAGYETEQPAAQSNTNPIGPALAACIGCCYAMRRTLNLSVVNDVRFSAYDLLSGSTATQGPDLTPTDLGDCLLVGCGAVGAGIAYLLPFTGSNATSLVLIDGDRVDYSNLNRVPLFFADHAATKAMKTEVVASYLNKLGIKSTIVPGRFSDAVSGGLKARSFDLVIPAANEEGVHADIQRQCPPIMVYGTTGEHWDAFLHRHIPLKEDCLSCRFPSNRPAPRFKCSESELEEPTEVSRDPEIGTLPFLSLFASTLALAEVIKISIPGFPLNKNYAVVSLGGKDVVSIVRQKKPTLCKDCWSPDVWARLGATKRFAHLSK